MAVEVAKSVTVVRLMVVCESREGGESCEGTDNNEGG